MQLITVNDRFTAEWTVFFSTAMKKNLFVENSKDFYNLYT